MTEEPDQCVWRSPDSFCTAPPALRSTTHTAQPQPALRSHPTTQLPNLLDSCLTNQPSTKVEGTRTCGGKWLRGTVRKCGGM
ncbi:MAG: hypothetical protein AAFU33_25605 [Bacteroidota bacterium]